jgi:hypothetical protein
MKKAETLINNGKWACLEVNTEYQIYFDVTSPECRAKMPQSKDSYWTVWKCGKVQISFPYI